MCTFIFPDQVMLHNRLYYPHKIWFIQIYSSLASSLYGPSILQYYTMHWNELLYTTLHYTSLHCTTLHYSSLHCYSKVLLQHCTALHCTALHGPVPNVVSIPQLTPNTASEGPTFLYLPKLHCAVMYYTSLHHTAFNPDVLLITALHCTLLHIPELPCNVL